MLRFGLLISLITVIIWASERVLSRFLLVAHHVHPIIFTCFSLFICSIVLILIAGPGKGGLTTLRQPHTWAYGAIQVMGNMTDMLVLALITASEASFMARFGIILAIVLKWIFFPNFKPNKYDWYGAPLILGGVAVVTLHLDESIRVMATFWLVMTVLLSTLRTLIAETHPSAMGAQTVRQRCRVTGYVVLTTSFVLTTLLFAFAGVKAASPAAESVALLAMMPSLTDLMDPTTLFAAAVMGLTLLPLAMYFYFYAAQVAKTEVFLMVTSVQPFLAYGLENLLQLMGWESVHQVTPTDLMAGVVIVCGALLMVFGRHRALLKTVDPTVHS